MEKIANLDNTNTWFTEAGLPYSDTNVRVSTRVTDVVYDDRSDFGHIQIFDTPFYGRMLTLDGIIQVAEKDEFIYHEMMVTLPAIKHGNPKNILIIGGGDGGAVKQATRIKSAERIVMVEIDQSVVDMCQKYIPSIADGSLNDPRVEIVIADGKDYIKNTTEKFDIVAMDLTDPIPEGPAAELYEIPFYQEVKDILSKNGVVSTHCSSLVIQPEEAKTMIPRLRTVFEEVVLHSAVIPTYQLTSFGFLIARPYYVKQTADDINRGFSNITGDSRYLSRQVFDASSAIPPYMEIS
jgi:spermidine synthase